MKEPLAWYIAGPLIGLFVPLIRYALKTSLGVSSSYNAILHKISKRPEISAQYSTGIEWQFYFAIGLLFAGISAVFFGFGDLSFPIDSYQPYTIWYNQLYSLEYAPLFVIGGIFIGYGARWAGGCTAGHCIYGVSQLSLGSVITTVCFFIGGLTASFVILPIIFK
jgi:uncharacterized membrane protein YedE/YeeE